MSTLSEYELKVAAEIVDRKREQADRAQRRRQIVPALIHDLPQRAVDTVRKLPGGATMTDLATAAYRQALLGIGKGLDATARRTLSSRAVVRRYVKHGAPVSTLRDVQTLDLETIDQVRTQGLSYRYAVGAGVEGAVAGLAMGGGSVLATVGTVLGAGAGAAPGFGVAAGAFAADTAAVLVASARLTAETAMFYGYDSKDEGEQLFNAAVLNAGTAVGTAAKNAAYTDLFRLTQMLTRGAPWTALGHSALTRVLQPMFRALTVRLTKAKLGQIVPVAGIAVGAGMNYAMIERVGQVAHWAYRERFLHDKGYVFDSVTLRNEDDIEDSTSSADEVVSVFEVAEEEHVVLEPAAPLEPPSS